LLHLRRSSVTRTHVAVSALAPMNKEFQARSIALLLLLFTVGAAVLAWINFQKEREFQVPSDGIWWVENRGTLVAEKLEADGPGRGPAQRVPVGVGDRDRRVVERRLDVHDRPADVASCLSLLGLGHGSVAPYWIES